MAALEHPLLTLQTLDDQYRLALQQKKSQHSTTNTWNGLGILFADQHLIIESREIEELFRLNIDMRIARVPGARPWFTGLISRRGRLLPLVNLGAYLFEEPTEISPTARVIVIGRNRENVGLVVNALGGLKRFSMEQQVTRGPAFTGKTPHYLAGVFEQDGDYWGVLSSAKLAEDPVFINAVRT